MNTELIRSILLTLQNMNPYQYQRSSWAKEQGYRLVCKFCRLDNKEHTATCIWRLMQDYDPTIAITEKLETNDN